MKPNWQTLYSMYKNYSVSPKGKVIRYAIFIAFFSLNPVLNVFGQGGSSELKNVVPPSPNVASLGKYGDVPVSLYTGIPKINIPLYDIKNADLNLSISVSYYSGGVRVEEVASSVGLGWTLNAGGIIGRNVRGLQDENNYWYPISPANSVEGIMNSNNAALQSQLAEDVESGYKDGEADIYYYNFGQYSGKFIFDQSGVAHSYPAKNLVITPYQAGFKIVTEDGTVYTFINYETNNPSNCGSDQIITTAWYLTNIKSADGKREITFTYNPSVYTYTTLLGQVKYISVNGQSSCMSDQNCLGTQHYVTHRLSRIDFGEGYLKFNYNNQRCDLVDDQSLDEIEIYTSNNTLMKRYKFAYSYFGNNSDGANRTTEHTKRLKLNSLTEETPTGHKPPYLFEYNTSVELPNRLSYAQDFWGYYNGKVGNPDLISKFTATLNGATVIFPGADRKANAATSQAAILTKIKYPMGGETVFTYENNTVSDNVIEMETTIQQMYLGWNGNANGMPNPYNSSSNLVLPAGGAEVNFYVSGLESWLWPGCDIAQCQLIKDGNPTPYMTIQNNLQGTSMILPAGTYTLRLIYECGYGSTANFSVTLEAMIPTPVVQPIRTVGGLRIRQIEDKPASGGPSIVKNYRYHPATDPAVSSGVLVNFPDFGYDLEVHDWAYEQYNHYCIYKVRQSFSTYPMATCQGSYVGYGNVVEDFGNNGETWHSFNAYGDGVSGFPFPPVENYDWRRGFEMGTKFFAKKNGQLVLVKEITNTPTPSFFNQFRIYGIKTGRNFIEKNAGMVVGAPYFYCVFTNYHNTVEFFDIAQTKEKIYDQNDPTKFIETVTDYTYSPQHLQVVQSKSITSKSDQTTKDEIITNKKYPFDYTFSGAPSGSEALGIKKLQDLHVVNAVVEEHTIRQNRNISTNQLSNQRVVGSSIATYKPDNPYPDQVLRLETTTPVTLSTFGTGSGVNANAFVYNSNSTVSSSYKPFLIFNSYDNYGNLTMQQKSGDVAYSYVWGYNNTYPVAEVAEASYSSIMGVLDPSVLNNPVSDAAMRTELNKIRLNFPAALATTYTYKPLVGMSSATDANGKTIYYEYDAFGRLSIIRDKDNNIVKKICYNYAGQAGECEPKAWIQSWNKLTIPYTMTLTNISTGVVTTYSVSPSSSAQQLGQLPFGNYNISLTPTNGSSTTVQVTYNGITQTGISFTINNLNISADILFTLENIAAPCSFTMSFGYSTPTNSISNNGGTVSFYLVFISNAGMTAGNTYTLATINGSCRPSVTRTINYSSSGRNWTITIYPSGQMTWYLGFGSTPVNPGASVGTSTLNYSL